MLDKLNEWKGGNFQTKINKMDGKTLLIKIAQSQAFKDSFSALSLSPFPSNKHAHVYPLQRNSRMTGKPRRRRSRVT
jgi:hypothetical protein